MGRSNVTASDSMIKINGKQLDIEREQLELLIERGNSADWIAEALLEAEHKNGANLSQESSSTAASSSA